VAVHHSYLPYCRRFLLFYLLVMAIVSFAKKVTLLVESLRKKDTGTDLAGKLLMVAILFDSLDHSLRTLQV